MQKKKFPDEKQLQEVTEHSTEDLKNSWDGPREEKAVLIQQQGLQHAPGRRDGDTSRVADTDPDWIRIQSGKWIRIQEGKNDPQK